MKGKPDNHIVAWLYVFVAIIAIVVFGCYLFYFNDRVSEKPDVWGDFGSYFGGILSPVVAGVTFYLITKSYEEQRNQTRLAALTSLINVNLMNISFLQAEYDMLLKEFNASATDKKLSQRLFFLNECSGLGGLLPDDPEFEQKLYEAGFRNCEYDSLLKGVGDEMGDEFVLIYHRIIEIKRSISEYQLDNQQLKDKVNKYCN
ncbi:hypothetical protein QZJ86_17525 [Methylomonas montana]|uniref:hypothetical protein n=1 Tax=Methylomonas montana TaxID=3058963 RepID=UPI002658521E|nr:hypothetical protein [Methylomonas montana]WKJ89796.1 hypothetical protein QZJ86_17525 [Methylomonas montana]